MVVQPVFGLHIVPDLCKGVIAAGRNDDKLANCRWGLGANFCTWNRKQKGISWDQRKLAVRNMVIMQRIWVESQVSKKEVRFGDLSISTKSDPSVSPGRYEADSYGCPPFPCRETTGCGGGTEKLKLWKETPSSKMEVRSGTMFRNMLKIYLNPYYCFF